MKIWSLSLLYMMVNWVLFCTVYYRQNNYFWLTKTESAELSVTEVRYIYVVLLVWLFMTIDNDNYYLTTLVYMPDLRPGYKYLEREISNNFKKKSLVAFYLQFYFCVFHILCRLAWHSNVPSHLRVQQVLNGKHQKHVHIQKHTRSQKTSAIKLIACMWCKC